MNWTVSLGKNDSNKFVPMHYAAGQVIEREFRNLEYLHMIIKVQPQYSYYIYHELNSRLKHIFCVILFLKQYAYR